MALDRESVKLVFQLDADAKPAEQELVKFRQSFSESLERVASGSEQHFARTSKAGSDSSKILNESFETAASEIIESWGVDGDIANTMAAMFTKLPTSAKIAFGGVGLAIIGAAATAGAFVVAANKILDVSAKIGTKSRDDFRELSKEMKEAGFNVTTLDRNLGQQLDQTAKRLQTTLDGLFLVMLRESGPEFVQLLDQINGLLNDSRGLARSLGETMGNAFKYIADTIFVARQELEYFTSQSLLKKLEYMIKLLNPNVTDRLQLLSEQAGRFSEGVISGKIKPPSERTTPPGATFDTKGGGKKAQDFTDDLARARSQREQALAQAEIDLAERAFREKALFATQYEEIVTAAELRILKAKQDAYAAEKASIQRDKDLTATQREAKLIELGTKEIQAIQQTEAAIARVKKEAADEQKRLEEQASKDRADEYNQRREREQRELEALSNFLQERNKILEQMQRDQVRLLDERAADLEQQAKRSPRLQGQAEAARREADIEAARLQNRLNLAQIEADRAEGLRLATSAQQREEIERLSNERKLQEYRRYRQARENIDQEFRARELEQQGFGSGEADAISREEAKAERQLTIWEQLRVGLRQWSADLQAEVPTIAATFSRMKDAVAESLAASVAAFASGRATLRQAAGQFFAAALAPLKDFLLKKSKAEFALALTEAAFGNYGGAAKHAAAGVALAAAAGFIDLGASAIAGSGAVAPGSSGAFSTGEQRPDKRTIEQGDRSRTQPQVIIIRAETHPDVTISRVVSDYKSNGATRTLFRSDMLGEGI